MQKSARRVVQVALITLCAVGFVWHAQQYEYVQDDAYISLVYARNFAEGNGLIFNEGERVEGYTNFLWTLLLVLPHALDLDAVACAQWWGVLSIVVSMLCCVAIAEVLDAQRHPFWGSVAPILLMANGALGFWALCGMETAFFTLLLTAGAYAYLRELDDKRVRYAPACLFALAALTRPEGLVFYALTALHRAGVHARAGRFILVEQVRLSLPFVALVGAHFVFRYAYYGALLPNTFYAKASWEVAYVEQGLQYTYQFIASYGLWGVLLLTPLALAWWSQQRLWFSYIVLLVLFNVGYVIAVGGDGWLQHRFYMPLLPLLYIALQELVCEVKTRLPLSPSLAAGASGVLVLVLAWHSYAHAVPSLERSQALFLEHNARVEQVAVHIQAQPQREWRLATGTIGIVKYRTRAHLTDLLGLTDEHIARNPQKLPGVVSDSGEVLRKYDIPYVLDQQPDLAFFLTGLKPVKAAEKALYLSRRFRRGYYAAYIGDEMAIFVRDAYAEPIVEDFADATFVEDYVAGLNAIDKDPSAAIEHLLRAIAAAPADFPYAHQSLGQVLMEMGREHEAMEVWQRALVIDPRGVKALVNLSLAHVRRGEFEAARPLAQRAVALSPHSQQVQLVAGLSQIFSHARTALEHLRTAADMPGVNGDEARFYLGLAHKTVGEVAQARSIWEGMLHRTPEDERLRRALDSL